MTKHGSGKIAKSSGKDENWGDVIKEGVLEKRSPSIFQGWQKRTFRLHELVLLYSQPKEWDPKDKQCIPIKNIDSIAPEENGVFRIFSVTRGPKKPYRLRASTEEEAEVWVDILRKTVLDTFKKTLWGKPHPPSIVESADTDTEPSGQPGSQKPAIGGYPSTPSRASSKISLRASSTPVYTNGNKSKIRLSTGTHHVHDKNWAEHCARALETRGEFDTVKKKRECAQVQAHVVQIESNRNSKDRKNKQSKNSMTTEQHRKAKNRWKKGVQAIGATKKLAEIAPLKSLHPDGPTLYQKLLDEGPRATLKVHYVKQVLTLVLEKLTEIMPQPVLRRPIPQGGRMVVVGDTHGQLCDVLLIFTLYGLPSEKNVYLFNGDIADRGPNACEIFLLMFTLFLCKPDCIIIHRGNHEDAEVNIRSVDEGGGFYDECVQKYGTGVFWEFVQVFKLLPLASIVQDEIFIVHGGLPRVPCSVEKFDQIQHTICCCPAPDASNVQDKLFVDLLWSDPQEEQGQEPNPRGMGCLFGPDITEAFLSKNKLKWIIRSHDLPHGDKGWEEYHLGRVFTVFSASNYCGIEYNWGAVCLLECDSSENVEVQMREHNIVDFQELQEILATDPGPEREAKCQEMGMALNDKKKVTVGERRVNLVLRRMAGIVLENKPELWQQFCMHDPHITGIIAREDWLEAMETVCGPDLNWEAASQHWLPGNPIEPVDYREFLSQFRVVLPDRRWCGWKGTVMQEVYGNLVKMNLTAQGVIQAIDQNSDGFVSSQEFVALLAEFTNGSLTQPQLESLAQTCFKHAQGTQGLKVDEFLSRFTMAFVQTEGMAPLQPGAPGADRGADRFQGWETLLEQIGRLLMMQYPDLTPAEKIRKTFEHFDTSKDGFLQPQEFVKGVSALPNFAAIHDDGKEVDTQTLTDLAQTLADSFSDDGLINLLEFTEAFVAVDATGASGLDDDVHEHILTFLYRHRHAMRTASAELDEDNTGYVEKEAFTSVLQAMNATAARPERHLTEAQIDVLVESISDDDGKVDFEAFLSAFQVQML